MLGLKESLPARQSIRTAWLIAIFGLLAAWSFWGHRGFQPFEVNGPIGQRDFVCLKSIAQTARPASLLATLDLGEWLPQTSMRKISVLQSREIADTSQTCKQLQHHLDVLFPSLRLFDHSSQPRPWIEAVQDDWKVDEMSMHTPFLLDYQLNGNTASAIIVNQLYLPGWAIEVNGKQMQQQDIERDLLPNGRMQINLPPGKWRIQAWYDGPSGWQVRNMSILALSILMLVYWSFRLCTTT